LNPVSYEKIQKVGDDGSVFFADPGLKRNPKLTSRFMQILTDRAGKRLMKTTDEVLCAMQISAMISRQKGRVFMM